MRAAHSLALVVIGDTALLAAIHLHIGGIQVDGDRALAQRGGALRGQQRQHPLRHRRDTAFCCLPLLASDPAGNARGGGRAQPRHRRDPLTGHISALAVQPGQEVFPGQLRHRDPGQ